MAIDDIIIRLFATALLLHCVLLLYQNYKYRNCEGDKEMAHVNNDGPLTVEKIKEALKEYDLIIRPKALVVSPRMKNKLLEAEPMIEQRVVLVENPACEDGTVYLIDRKDIEKYSEARDEQT